MPIVPAASAAPVPTSPIVHAGLAAQAGTASASTADEDWYRSITSFAQHTPWLQSAMEFYTVAGIGLLLLLALYAAWTARARADQARMAAVIWLGLGTALSISCGLVLKQVFQESRPCGLLDGGARAGPGAAPARSARPAGQDGRADGPDQPARLRSCSGPD